MHGEIHKELMYRALMSGEATDSQNINKYGTVACRTVTRGRKVTTAGGVVGAGVVIPGVVEQFPCVKVGLSAESSSMSVGLTSTQKVL